MKSEGMFEDKCRSEIHRYTVRYNWTVIDCSLLNPSLSSPEFPTSAPEGVGRWCLILLRSQGFNLQFHLKLKVTAQEAITANVKISLIDCLGFYPKAGQIYKFNSCNNFELKNFVERNNVHKGDEFTIACEIIIDNWRAEESATVECPLSELVEDMGNLLSLGSLSDVTITAGEREFRVHKAILAARSPVFAAMFRNEMVENKIGAVKITDIDPEVFHQMLEYIYTGNNISSTEMTNELLAAANKYNIKGLKRQCERKLCKELSVENVLHYFALADLYNASDLKDKALSFFKNHRPSVIKSSSWESFKSSHQHILKEICDSI